MQEKLNATTPTLKLIYTLNVMPYTTSAQFRVDGHFESVRNNRQLPRPLAKDRKTL